MAKKFVQLQKHPSDMTSDELMDALAGHMDSVVMRSLIIAEMEAIRAGVEREHRTMRNLWYKQIKPALTRIGILNKATKKGRPIPWEDKLSVYIAELVREGITSYEELRIIDGSRQRQPAIAITATVAEVHLVGAHFPWVILFTEKDTIWEIVQSLAELYGVSAISGGGQPSNACTENTIRSIIRSDTFQENCPGEIVLLSLTDYDPAGYTIASAQHTQIHEVAEAMPASERGGLEEVSHIRLGLVPDQLTLEERLANAYEPKDKGLKEWFEETDGVDGKPLGLELDALPLSRLRQMYAGGIERHIDLEKRRDDLRNAFIDILAYDVLKPEIERRLNTLRQSILSSETGVAIMQTELPDNLFRTAATQGLNCINPVDSALFNCEDEARAQMLESARKFGQA